MTLHSSLLRQLENPNLSQGQRAELHCQLAKELEERGDYDAARLAMGEFWQRIGEYPNIRGLEQSTAGEVLLRVGTLTGWIGSSQRITDAQETAKNLISESITIFGSLNYVKKILEAQTELSVCYWRQGSYDEARIILQGVLARLTTDNELKAKAILRHSIVERSASRFSDALRILTDGAALFKKINNHLIKGGYHNEFGVVLKNLAESERREDYIDRAFIEYAAASFHFERAGHKPYRALVENNLGFLFFKAGKFIDAHKHLIRARNLFWDLKDLCSVAQVDDTRAQAFLAEGRYAKAEDVARAAVRALEKGGRQSLLAEAMVTHGTALARLGFRPQAQATLHRAVEVAHQAGDNEDAGLAALTMIEELSEDLTADEMHDVYELACQWLINSQHPRILHRLHQAANRVLAARRGGQQQDEEMEKPGASGFAEMKTEAALGDVIRQHEHDLISQALASAEGSVTRAARLLGLSHQALAYILEHRHKELLSARKPVRRRRRSITKNE